LRTGAAVIAEPLCSSAARSTPADQVGALAEHSGRGEHRSPSARLFHSDECRSTNWTTWQTDGRTKRHEYPRCTSTNKSTDIVGTCAAGLERLDIALHTSRSDAISVARRAAVAALDVHVGPKT
jgi:hypothetical protein